VDHKRTGKVLGRPNGVFWTGYLSGKGLSREVAARGQMDFESSVWGKNQGASRVSDKAGGE